MPAYTWKHKGWMKNCCSLTLPMPPRFFIIPQCSSYPIQLIGEGISVDGSSIQSDTVGFQFQAQNCYFVVPQRVSPPVAVFKYFCLQVALQKATEEMLGPSPLFGVELLVL